MFKITFLPSVGRHTQFISIFLTGLSLLLAFPTAASAIRKDDNGIWAGIADKGSHITRVSGEFVVPKISDRCGPHANAAVWVGMGYDAPQFAQIGVTLTHGSMGGWYQLEQSRTQGYERDISFGLKTGDTVRLRLAFTDDLNTLNMYWVNLTTGQRVVKSIDNAKKYFGGDAAEWIIERADISNTNTYILAQFSPITFKNAWYGTSSTDVTPLKPATYNEAMFGGRWLGKPLTTTTVSQTSKWSFTTKWLACQ